MGNIRYFSEDIRFNIKDKRKITKWIKGTIESEEKIPGSLNYIFCSDSYLLNLNNQFLNHNTLTDIITFDSAETETEVSGDIYISVERVQENAPIHKTTFTDELHRIMIHGALHLCGYKDKSKKDKVEMTAKENHYLKKREMFHVEH